MEENKICPNCGNEIIGYPALSRKDNKTQICSACGQKEAISDLMSSYGKRSSQKVKASMSPEEYKKEMKRRSAIGLAKRWPKNDNKNNGE